MPSPVGLVVKNGWNSLSLISGGMPVPLSRIADLDRIAEIARRHRQGRPELRVAALALALGGGIEAIAEQVEEHAGHLLRHQFDRGEAAVVIALQRDVEALILGAGTVVGEVQGLLDQVVEIDLPALARDPARMLQHALDDVVGAPAVLGDLFEVAGQHLDRLVDLGALVLVERGDAPARRSPSTRPAVRPTARRSC